MSISTHRGDGGETDLPGGFRVPKDSPLLDVCGDLEELGALLGLARCEPLPEAISALLEQVQHQLFAIGGQLTGSSTYGSIGPEQVDELQRIIDRYEPTLPLLDTFILPAGSRGASLLHLARAVCRRIERRLVAMLRSHAKTSARDELLPYLNRLGDLLFVCARVANRHAGVEDTPCQPNSQRLPD